MAYDIPAFYPLYICCLTWSLRMNQTNRDALSPSFSSHSSSPFLSLSLSLRFYQLVTLFELSSPVQMRRPKRGSSSMCRDKNLKGPQPDIMPTSNIPIRLRILVLDVDADFLTFISGLLKLLKHEGTRLRNHHSI